MMEVVGSRVAVMMIRRMFCTSAGTVDVDVAVDVVGAVHRRARRRAAISGGLAKRESRGGWD